MKYLCITRGYNGSIAIQAETPGKQYDKLIYWNYSERAAIKHYRRENGLNRKHFSIIRF